MPKLDALVLRRASAVNHCVALVSRSESRGARTLFRGLSGPYTQESAPFLELSLSLLFLSFCLSQAFAGSTCLLCEASICCHRKVPLRLSTMSLFARAFRRELPEERKARKRLEEYFRNTRNERQELKNTCDAFLTPFYFPKGGKEVRNRLLKEEPSKEWTTLFMWYLRLEVQAMC